MKKSTAVVNILIDEKELTTAGLIPIILQKYVFNETLIGIITADRLLNKRIPSIIPL